MDFEEFKEQFAEDVKSQLSERGMQDAEVTTQQIEKMNNTYEAMTIIPAGGNIGVNVNVDQFFDEYQNGTDYAEVVDHAMSAIEKGIDDIPQINTAELADYEKMKGKLSMEVVSAETNADLLTKVPHEQMEDMAVVYRLVLNSDEDGRASVLVTNNLLNQFGITEEQLHADAMVNAPEIRPATIQGMTEVMTQLMGEEFLEMAPEMDPADELMFVASVPDRIHGAGVIAYQDFMDQAAEKLGGDFYVLPSSIHEVLLVKDNGEASADSLKSMVQEVNENEVRPEEKLTDNVYHYDSKDHVFELAEKFEARMQEKEMDAQEVSPEEEKGSVLKDLKEKQKEIAAKPQAKEAVQKAANKNKGGEAI